MNDNERKRIVIAEDNRELCEVLTVILAREGYRVDCVYDGFSLLAYLKDNQDIDAIILDLIMPDRSGMSIFETVRSVSPASKVIIYTGYTIYRHSVFGRAADAFVDKVDGAEKLIEVLKKLLE